MLPNHFAKNRNDLVEDSCPGYVTYDTGSEGEAFDNTAFWFFLTPIPVGKMGSGERHDRTYIQVRTRFSHNFIAGMSYSFGPNLVITSSLPARPLPY